MLQNTFKFSIKIEKTFKAIFQAILDFGGSTHVYNVQCLCENPTQTILPLRGGKNGQWIQINIKLTHYYTTSRVIILR